MPADLKVQNKIQDDITARLRELGKTKMNRAIKEGLNEAGRVLAAEMSSMAPVGRDPRLVPELLKKAIGFKTKSYRHRGQDTIVVLIVGPRSGFKTNKKTGVRKKTRFAKIIGKNAKGQDVYQNPTQYAHLAGPGRKATFGRDAALRARLVAEYALLQRLRQVIGER